MWILRKHCILRRKGYTYTGEIYLTDRRFDMILSAKKYAAALLVFVCVCMIFSPLTAYAAEDSSQHETVKVGFFAMDGYHVMDE